MLRGHTPGDHSATSAAMRTGATQTTQTMILSTSLCQTLTQVVKFTLFPYSYRSIMAHYLLAGKDLGHYGLLEFF